MKRSNVVKILKDQMKEICRGCDTRRIKAKESIADIDTCFTCPVHKLVNKVLEALNGN